MLFNGQLTQKILNRLYSGCRESIYYILCLTQIADIEQSTLHTYGRITTIHTRQDSQPAISMFSNLFNFQNKQKEGQDHAGGGSEKEPSSKSKGLFKNKNKKQQQQQLQQQQQQQQQQEQEQQLQQLQQPQEPQDEEGFQVRNHIIYLLTYVHRILPDLDSALFFYNAF